MQGNTTCGRPGHPGRTRAVIRSNAMRMQSGTLIAITLVMVSTTAAQQGSGDSKREILAARAAWNKAMAEHDAEAVSRMLAPDYSVVNAAYQRRGMTAERDGLAALFNARPDLLFKRTPTRVVVSDGTGNASEQGNWIERWTEKDGPTQLQGTYFVLWRRIDGAWKEQAVVFAPEICKGGSYCRPNEPRVYHEAPEDVLRKYIGWFQMSDGSVLEIRREGAYLVAQGRPLGHRILIPKSTNEFHTYTPRKEWEPVVARFRSSPEDVNVSVELSEGGKRLLAGRKLLPSAAAVTSEQSRTAEQIEAVEREIDRAIVRRDTATLTTKLATSFTRIHTLGPVEVATSSSNGSQRETRWSGSEPMTPQSSM